MAASCKGNFALHTVRMRVLIAMDKYKGCLTAVQAGEAVSRGLKQTLPGVETALCPIADGGEGFTDTLVAALSAEWIEVPVLDAIGRPVVALYGLTKDRVAVMEMSAASGLAMVSDQPLQPEIASTFGTGQLMRDAIQRGARKIIIGIGGSATNDGGRGMAEALGFGFTDTGIASPAPLSCEVLVACDVDNPLLGERGATRVYGAQKGVQDFAFFEARMQTFADLITRELGVDHRSEPGAGAAGGMGFGLMSFCQARLMSGFDLVADITQLEARMAEADLVITGEGKVDGQTLHGKGPAGVAEMARQQGKPVIAVAGMVEDSPAVRARFNLALAVKPEAMPLAEAMARGAELIEETVAQHAAQFRELVL